MADLVLSPRDIAEKLHDIFMPALETWSRASGLSPALRNEAEGKNATQILEADLKELGRYVICGDDRATRIELGLVVDCLSALHAKGDKVIARYTADKLSEEFGIHDLQNTGSRWMPQPDAMDLPLSLRIVLDGERIGLPMKTDMLRSVFIEFIHAIVLRDGQLTREEIAHAKQIEDILIALTERSKPR